MSVRQDFDTWDTDYKTIRFPFNLELFIRKTGFIGKILFKIIVIIIYYTKIRRKAS